MLQVLALARDIDLLPSVKSSRLQWSVLVVCFLLSAVQLWFSGFTIILQSGFRLFFSDHLAYRLADGVVGTVGISATAIITGTLSGLFLAYALRHIRARQPRAVRIVAWTLLYLGLATPAYLLIYLGQFIVDVQPWYVASAALAINLAVFIGKIVYGGFSSIPEPQLEAARAIGVEGASLILFFEIPALIRVVGNAVVVEWATTLKLSSLVGVIGANDIMKVAKDQAGETFQDGTYLIVILVYFVLVAPLFIWVDQRHKT